MAAAKDFCDALCGWIYDRCPAPEGGRYSSTKLRGEEVSALFKQGPDMASILPHWTGYVSVVDGEGPISARSSKTVIDPPLA